MVRKTKKVYVRWSFVYMLVPALILAIIVFCGIRFIQYEMKNELVQSHKATAELIDSKLEKFLIDNETTAKNIKTNSKLLELMQKTDHNIEFYNELQKFNSGITAAFSGEYISDYAIYIDSNESFIHTASLLSAKTFYKGYCPDNVSDYEAWKELVSEEHISDMYRSKNGDILYFVTIYKNANSASQKLGTLILKIPNVVLKGEFAESIKQGTANVILQQKGRVIYSLYEENSPSCTESPFKKGTFSENGVMYIKSKVGVLDVTYAVNEGDAFRRLMLYEKLVAIIAMLLFVIGTAFTFVLSKWQYKPLENLVKRFSGTYDRDCKNEFEYINASIDYYEKQQRASIEKLARYREAALSQMLVRHILKNGCTNLQDVLKKCDYNLESRYNAIVIISIDTVDEGLWSGSNEDHNLMHFAIENVCTELFDEEFSLLTLPVNDSYYTGLVSSENGEDFSEKLKEIYSKVEEVLRGLGVGLAIRIGEQFTDIEYLRQAYNKVEPKAQKAENKHNADLVKIWEEASDTSDVKNAEKRINEVMAYIDKNYSDSSLTMESIAHHIGLNSRYMLKIFKEQTGVLLKDYVLKIRIDKATELLKTDMTIEAVAKKCGYTSSHSFIRAFKRACGITPGEMRQASEEKFDE